jgi:hypothetical protein
MENSRDGFQSCLGSRVEERKVESRSSERALQPVPPQQIDCRVGVPIIPDPKAGLGWRKKGEDD